MQLHDVLLLEERALEQLAQELFLETHELHLARDRRAASRTCLGAVKNLLGHVPTIGLSIKPTILQEDVLNPEPSRDFDN